MKINEMIRERHIAKKLTQEQMAGYLGVTAPAVNKWEKGTSYPDITLLPALARLLDTDLNTLLSFQEDLSDREIALFLNELSELSEKEGVETLYVRALNSSDSAIQNQAKANMGLQNCRYFPEPKTYIYHKTDYARLRRTSRLSVCRQCS